MIDKQNAVKLLRGLVAIPSLSREEAEASRWLVAQMQSLGYDRAFVDDAGNAVGEMGAQDASHTILLLGHIDTVPGDIPVRIAATDDGDVLYGRGSVDAKGPLATFTAAVGKLGAAFAHENDLRLIVVGAVEEESATSKGARFIRDRFNGDGEPIPHACIIGEPSSWRRVTLGYKGRILMEFTAQQPMAHTAGPDRGVATRAVDAWNWLAAHADEFNVGKEKAFDQLLPSLRHLQTITDAEMNDQVTMRAGIRLPHNFDVNEFIGQFLQHITSDADAISSTSPLAPENPAHYQCTIHNQQFTIKFHAHEPAWRSDRNNPLVRSFQAAIRTISEEYAPGTRPGFVSKTGTSDMNVVGPAWQCPILAYGPGDSTLDHTPNEHVALDEYWRAVLVLEQALRNLAQTL